MSPHHIAAACVTALMITVGAWQPAMAQTAEMDHAGIARTAMDGHIQPGYQQLSEALGKLEADAATLCKSPDPSKLDAVRGRFIDVVKAWGGIAHIDFGPIRVENRYERLWFWPDRKGIAQRQVLGALRSKPDSYLDARTLGEQSIAVQGLGALELALYRDGAEKMAQPGDAPGFRCRYVKAIAANLKNIATAVRTEWRADGAFGGLWLNPGSQNRTFLRQRETSFALLRSLMNALTRVRDTELARPLGVTQSRRVLPGPFAESKATMLFIAARIDGLRSLLVDAGLAKEMMRVARAHGDDESTSDVEQARFELTFASKRAAELADIRGLLNDPAQRSKAAPLGFPLKSANDSIAGAAGRLTKLPVGYNASDGD